MEMSWTKKKEGRTASLNMGRFGRSIEMIIQSFPPSDQGRSDGEVQISAVCEAYRGYVGAYWFE